MRVCEVLASIGLLEPLLNLVLCFLPSTSHPAVGFQLVFTICLFVCLFDYIIALKLAQLLEPNNVVAQVIQWLQSKRGPGVT